MPRKILIVDDEAEVVDITRSVLEKRGYDVCVAFNGIEGLEQAAKERPDLILTDVLMPEMDGFSFYKELKKNKDLTGIPVLIVTARGKMEDSFKVIGAAGFISKPFTPQELATEIENIIGVVEAHEQISSGKKKVAKKMLAVGSIKEVMDEIALQSARMGIETHTTQMGADAIAKAVQCTPDIIVIDVQMQDMSIYELIDVLRKLPKFTQNPIIGYSYYDTDKLEDPTVRQRMLDIHKAQERFIEAGGNEYIGRFNTHNFTKKISSYLSSKSPKK